MKVKYIALTVSLLSFALGFSDLQENMFFELMRPVGAIAFIVFFIFAILGREFSILDQQEALKLRSLNRRDSSASALRRSAPSIAHRPPASVAARS